MPATIPVGDEVPIFIVGQDAQGNIGVNANGQPITLPPGASISIVSGDPNTVTFTPDATPGMSPANPNATPPVPAYQSVLSGEVVSAASPAQPGVAITLTMTLTFAAGGPAPFVLTDTVTVSPDVAVAIGDIFGTPVAVPAPTPVSVKRR